MANKAVVLPLARDVSAFNLKTDSRRAKTEVGRGDMLCIEIILRFA